MTRLLRAQVRLIALDTAFMVLRVRERHGVTILASNLTEAIRTIQWQADAIEVGIQRALAEADIELAEFPLPAIPDEEMT